MVLYVPRQKVQSGWLGSLGIRAVKAYFDLTVMDRPKSGQAHGKDAADTQKEHGNRGIKNERLVHKTLVIGR